MLKSSRPSASAAFGSTVALDGDVLIVGAPNDNRPSSLAGTAEVFVRRNGTWTSQQFLQPSTLGTNANFGFAVSVRGGSHRRRGHLLGLGHTTVRGATMAKVAVGVETEKRSLESDDRLGYCALDLPEFECEDSSCTCAPPPIFPSTRTVRTCGCRILGSKPLGASHPLFGHCLLGFSLVGWRVRRRWQTRG